MTGERAKRSRRRALRGAALVALMLAILVAVLALGVGADHAEVRRPALGVEPSRSPAQPAVLRIAPGAVAVPVSQSFLGLSTEYWTIPGWARHLNALGRVISSISPQTPLVLRIGGSSANRMFWAPSRELAEWRFDTTPAWLMQLRRIVARFGVHVILDLNLDTGTPQTAVQWVRAAKAGLPARSIVGFEIGNEADTYNHASWQRLMGARVGSRALPRRITPDTYSNSYRLYATALARVDPGVPLFGPALSKPLSHLRWISNLLTGPHPGLGAITVHRYPLSACSRPGARMFPTIARLLSENATGGMARTIDPAISTARRAGLPVEVTELNSVTCGGREGVSDAFASALWAPDALFELVKAGAGSADIHVRANAVNAAFSLTPRGLVANPLLYGLELFSRTLGPKPQFVPLRLQTAASLRLKAWAVRVGTNRLHVLLINKGINAARVSLRIPSLAHVSAQQLLAPLATSTSGVTLDGQHLDAQGRWRGRRATVALRPGSGYAVTVRGLSATLLTGSVLPGSLTG